MAQTSGVEHSVHIIPADGGAGAGEGELVATAERRLNCFVRYVALIERLGNALGTLAFTWATVVLLGGYPTVLRSDNDKNDFWFATIIFFLEAFRMFSRNNRADYKLFFGTRGAFRLLGWNWLVLLIVYFNGVVLCFPLLSPVLFLPLLGILVAIGQFLFPGARRLLARIPLWLRRVISLWSPVIAISLLLGAYVHQYSLSKQQVNENPYQTYFQLRHYKVAICIAYGVLLVVVLLVTVSRMRFAGIIKLADSVLGSKQEFWRRVVLNLCMIGAIVTAAFSFDIIDIWYIPLLMIVVEVSTIVLASFGNFQVPSAVLRVVLPLVRFGSISHDYLCKEDDDMGSHAPAPAPSGGGCNPSIINLTPSLYIFYGMVLGQGALYLVACVVEIFSFIPRRFLIRRGGFKGQWGVDSINLYYSYDLDKCLERNVLAPNISLCKFAIVYLNSDSTKKQLHGIRIAHTLLQREPTRTRLLVKLKASTKTMTRLMRMLHQENQATIRFFAAKVIDELAKSLLVINCPGIVQNVSLLLDWGNNQHKRVNPLLDDTDEEQEQKNDLSVNAIGNRTERGDAVGDSGNLLETQESSTQQIDISNKKNSWITKQWRQVYEFWSIPQEGPLTEQDLLPVIGMSIIESLVTYDQNNCSEISSAANLIRKITRFTRFCRTDTNYTDAEKKVLVHSSLKLLYKLTSIDGEIGITLRHKISQHPFLLRNLSEVLGDITSNCETKKVASGIIRNLAIDASMRLAIGRVQKIITGLMHAFLTPDEPSSSTGASVSHSEEALRKVAGQALAMLAIGNGSNCLAMLRQTGYSFIKELTKLIDDDRYTYRCVAASLLRSVLMHARPDVKETDLKQLSYMVLGRILRADGEELEIFIGLSSHIYEAIPEELAKDFEYGQIKVTFVKRLVDALNANMEPNADCPGIMRVILEQAIELMKYDSSNTVNYFRDLHMIEVLSMVEETILEAENYTIFMGDVGLMEAGEPLSSLVARAKQLLDAH
ncbi:hypothetical protein BDA96_07G009200 [Sorghum bicolor]|uniref:BLE2 protein n=1 Tax=Sorghum bicolor TaxID=4558 RepID=A0A921U8A9_SORBI|nr:hypothetical protein BDA96_07G009200 [Sorghum bicolor]